MVETQNSTTLSFSFSFILLFAQLCTALFFFFPLLTSCFGAGRRLFSSPRALSQIHVFFFCVLYFASIGGALVEAFPQGLLSPFFFSSFYLVYRHLYCYSFVSEGHTSASLTPILVRSLFSFFLITAKGSSVRTFRLLIHISF